MEPEQQHAHLISLKGIFVVGGKITILYSLEQEESRCDLRKENSHE